VGGNSVTIQQYPHQVSILIDNELWCGGSIVSKYSVLTAAHCVLNAEKPLVVHAGSSLWKKGGSYHHVKTYYTYGTAPNTDLSVLRVIQPFVFDETRQPIK
jgi:secreted trypsin-like serine protease